MPEKTAPSHTWTRRDRAWAGGAAGLALAALLWLARGLPVVERLELPLVDARTTAFAGATAPDPTIVLVEVQDDDVRVMQDQKRMPWPWDLEVDATCIQVLADAGARALLMDVVYLNQGQGADDRPVSAPPLSTEEEMALLGAAASAEAFGGALQALGRSALAFELSRDPRWEVPVRVAAGQAKFAPPGLAAPPGALARPGADLPARRLIEGATWLGYVNAVPDRDGVLRRASVIGLWGDRPAMHLALAGLLAATGETARLEEGDLRLGDRRVPLADDGTFYVDFRGPANRAYRRVSPTQLILWNDRRDPQGKLPQDARQALEGAIVVWGINLSGQKDVVTTPVATAGNHHGPELVATVVDNLKNGGGRLRASGLANGLLLVVLLAGIGAWGASTHRKAAPHLIGIGAILLVGAVAVLAFRAGRILDVGTPWIGILLVSGATFTLRWATEGRYNRWLEGAFGRYLSPSVIVALKEDPGLLSLGGRRRDVTILFSDVAGFTQVSRKLTPEQLVQLLNEYLTLHGRCVFAQDGLIDKFIGDAVMAIYGDPVPVPDHALRACRSALEVQARLPELEPLWRGLGLDEFHVRIGLNSGPAVVGNMGSRDRFDYTAMGDTVNLASRLEGANKYFGSSILIGPRTYEGAKDGILARPLARVQVVGYDAPVPIYELVALRESATPAQVAHVGAFARAQDAARAGDVAAALAALDESERIWPGTGPVAWFRGVLEKIRDGKAPSPWSCEIVLGAK